jgi:hypothetical protein
LQKPKLYGWGLNSSGQLGIDTGANNVPQPVDIPLPFSGGNNIIVDIICGTQQSIIQTENAGIWITEPIEKKQPVQEKKEKDSEKEKPEKGKKGKKFEEKEVVEKEKEKPRWTNIQQLCEKSK